MSFAGEVNFVAYDDVESLDNYRSTAELDAYRAERLGMYAPQVEFLRALGSPAGGIRAVDVGSGSSAFLYALERAGILAHGVGIELSATRHAFAERWRLDAGFERVANLHGDVLQAEIEPGSFDLFAVIDDTYLLLRAEDEHYPELLLEAARRALAPGGRFLAAFRNDAVMAAGLVGGERSFWLELPASNAFKYALYRQKLSPEGTFLRNESVYITRELTEKRKVEITEICDVPRLVESLGEVGFGSVAVHADFASTPFDPERSRHAVVIAEV